MTSKKKSPPPIAPQSVPVGVVPDESWTVAQVASHMGLSYQTARNQMLQGIFGQSNYDASKRQLTVSGNQVKRVKTRKTKPKIKRPRTDDAAPQSQTSVSPRRRPPKSA